MTIPNTVTANIVLLPNLSERYVLNAQKYIPKEAIAVANENIAVAVFSVNSDKNSFIILEGTTVGNEVV
jgi:hypothetical protein